MAEARNVVARSSRVFLMLAALIAVLGVGTALWRAAPTRAPAALPAPRAADAESTIAQFEARLKAQPNDPEGWHTLGDAFFESRRFGESAMAYKRAAQLAPAMAVYWSAFGEALVLAGAGGIDADARSAFQTALARDPADPRARYYLAVGKDMMGDHKGAVADWLALLAASPADAPWVSDVRKAIVKVGVKNHINVAARLAAIKPMISGAGIASAAIPGPTPEQMRTASAMPKGQQDTMVNQMVEGLAAKLAANPANVDGWIMLMRSRVTLGQSAQASAALRAALAANPASAARLNAAARELGIAS